MARHKVADALVVIGWGLILTGMFTLASPYQFEAMATIAVGLIFIILGVIIQ